MVSIFTTCHNVHKIRALPHAQFLSHQTANYFHETASTYQIGLLIEVYNFIV